MTFTQNPDACEAETDDGFPCEKKPSHDGQHAAVVAPGVVHLWGGS